MTLVKICGVSEPRHARAAASFGAEPRLRAGRPLLVGVFADQDADTINGIAEECGLDLVQLSGSEPWEMCGLVSRPVLKCLKGREGQGLAEGLALGHRGA